MKCTLNHKRVKSIKKQCVAEAGELLMHAEERTLSFQLYSIHAMFPLKPRVIIKKLRNFRAPIPHKARTKMEPQEKRSYVAYIP